MTILRRVIRALNNPVTLAWTVLGTWVFASMAFSLIEHKGPIQGLWWGIVTGSTVGYGDYSPATTIGRGIGALFILSMAVLLIFVNAHVTARAVEDNSPAAFTAEEQERMFASLDEIRRALETAEARAWEVGFDAHMLEAAKKEVQPGYVIHRDNPYKKEIR